MSHSHLDNMSHSEPASRGSDILKPSTFEFDADNLLDAVAFILAAKGKMIDMTMHVWKDDGVCTVSFTSRNYGWDTFCHLARPWKRIFDTMAEA